MHGLPGFKFVKPSELLLNYIKAGREHTRITAGKYIHREYHGKCSKESIVHNIHTNQDNGIGIAVIGNLRLDIQRGKLTI